VAALDALGDLFDFVLGNTFFLVHRVVRLMDGGHDFAPVKSNYGPISLNYLHEISTSWVQ
jgi:hypothetical protein